MRGGGVMVFVSAWVSCAYYLRDVLAHYPHRLKTMSEKMH